MATITTGGTGAWNSTTPNAPWPGGTIPTSADKVVIAAGHTVTVPAGYTAAVGDPATFAADVLKWTDSSTTLALVIAGTLLLHGGVIQGDRPAQVQKDSGITFDYGSHLTPILWVQGDAFNEPNSSLKGSTDATAPTPTHPVTFQSAAGQSNKGHAFTNAGNFAGQVDIQAMKLIGLGTSTVPCFTPNTLLAGAVFRIGWCIADGCGELFREAGAHSGGIFSVSNTTIRNSVTAATARGFEFVSDGSGAAITGTRAFTRIRSDRKLYFRGNGVSLSDIVVDLGATNTDAIDTTFPGTSLALADKVVTRSGMASSPGMLLHPGDSLTNGYAVNQGGLNPRWWAMASDGDAAPKTTSISDCIVQRAGGDGLGDPFVQTTNPATVQTYVFRRYLVLHNALNRAQQTAKIVSPVGNISNLRYDIEHCTWMSYISAVETAIQMGEAQTANVGQIWNSIRSNIAWAPGTALTDRWIFRPITASVETNPLTAANVDYNGKFNLASDGVNPAGYKSMDGVSLVASGTLGAHDVVGDPKFLDPGLRDMGAWHAHHIGSSFTGNEQAFLDAAFAAMMLANDVDGSYDSFYEIAGSATALVPWVTAGYAPTNPAFRNADHTGAGEPGAHPGIFQHGAPRLSLGLRLAVS